LVPFAAANGGAIVELAHDQCTVLREEYSEEGTRLEIRAPRAIAARFGEFTVLEN
jgi:hypothetical protein